jgi:signal transduction histidine kinase/ligand-binding sensor domain-containing protein
MGVRALILLCWAITCWKYAVATPMDKELTFERTTWTQKQGGPTFTLGIDQTDDGLLWFASPNGLYQYDGEKFQKVDSVFGHRLLSRSAVHVLAIKGGLIVGYRFGGVSIFTKEGVRNFRTSNGIPPGSIHALKKAPDGKVYVGTSTGLGVFDGTTWSPLTGKSVPKGLVGEINFDNDGTLWVLVGTKLFTRARDSSNFVEAYQVPNRSTSNIVRGRLFADLGKSSPLQLQIGKAPAQVKLNGIRKVNDIWEGPYSSLWAWAGAEAGLSLLREERDGSLAVAQSFEAGGTPARLPSRVFVDRENNFWVATFGGVERYRARRIQEVSLPSEWWYLYAQRGLGDSIYIASESDAGLKRLVGNGYAAQAGIPNAKAIWRENAESVWVGSTSNIAHVTPGGVKQWPLPPGTPDGYPVQSIVVDRLGSVWVSVVRQGLYRFSQGTWTHVDTSVIGLDATPIIMYSGSSGRTWIGFTNNRIGEIVGNVVQLVHQKAAANLGNILSLLEVDGRLLVGGELGIGWMDANGLVAMAPERLDAFQGISGMGLDKAGDLWAHGTDGVFHISKDELVKFWANPRGRVAWEVFNFEDGVRGTAEQIRPLPTLAIADDGRVIYATSAQVGWIDPSSIRRNTRPPTVLVRSLRAGDLVFEPNQEIRLAPGTTSVEIGFAATALSIPERVRFRYQLIDVDKTWEEPQGGRFARYTNLSPGAYTFRVIAANEDGVWNKDGATITFEIVPAIWQTTWFRLTVLGLLLLSIFALYRWRIAAVAKRAAERMAARLEERERIARNLHDNLLQGVYALILRCHTVLTRLPKGSKEEMILEDALNQADRLIADTRDEVMGLRDNQSATQIVSELCEELEAIEPSVKGRLKLAMSGDVARLKPNVARELYQVLKEAITNAARHSSATEITATVQASEQAVEGSVIDNGIGIPPEIAVAGRAGHWGIVGMRERIAKLGGTLTIESDAEKGTALSFAIDAVSAYS